MKDEATPEQIAMRSKVARAIMETRVRWGWTFGKQKRVMAIDLLMADAAITVLRAENARLTEERDALVETMKTIAKSSMDSVTRHEARSSLAKVKGSPDAR